MMKIKGIFGGLGAKQVAELPPLLLSWSLCNALTTVSQIFGQTWHMPVVGELNRALRGANPPSGQLLAGIILRLVEEAAITRPGLPARFMINRNQIVYRTADRRYVVLIVQGEGETVRVIWQVAVRNAGTSFISYEVKGQVWSVVEWKVADQSQDNLELLAKAGGEVLGFLEELKLLPESSPFQRALESHVARTASFRERSR